MNTASIQGSSPALVWLRRDFRLEDHVPLARATAAHSRVFLAFVIDPRTLEEFAPGSKPHASFFGALLELQAELEALGAGVCLLEGKPEEEIPRLCRQLKVGAVYAGKDYEPGSRARDAKVSLKLAEQGVSLHLLKDQVLWEENEVLTGSNLPYRVFTPYKNASFERSRRVGHSPEKIRLSHLAPGQGPESAPLWRKLTELVERGVQESGSLIRPGARAARQRLEHFVERALTGYGESRNLPAVAGTSLLSQDLRNGALSPRHIWNRVVSEKGLPLQDKQTFLSELVWRDFFHMIGFHFPHVFERNYNPKYDSLRWRNSPEEFQAWREGRTGYPIVDAGIRELIKTGFMHNRVRMITAMFLTKDLLIDWRWGERFFREHLIDGDLCVNNGNWQWCASTGVDAQPYFRIFNPTTQSEKFDPDGGYLKAQLPSLEQKKGKALHQPGYGGLSPIVDHALARTRCLDAFQLAAQSEA